jgi:pyruvate kinase
MLSQRRVKIVATLGPSTNTETPLEKAILAGLNVARLNFSHGTHDDHRSVIDIIRKISKKHRAPVAILQDLQGPKIRVGHFKNGSTELKPGDQVEISPSFKEGDGLQIPTDFNELPQSVKEGSKILLDDGLMELKVTSVTGDIVKAQVIFGGILKNRKGINLPGANLPVNCLTEKDLEDLEFGLKHKVDYVALSFVRQGSDIRKLRELVNAKSPGTRIIAKIEMLEAIENLKEIVELSDGVMVARGDLAVEVGQTQLPMIQKQIIGLCNELGKPVITATQMLDSMVENPRPTRAEITDVANAVLDGTDALMLSAETASGKYPVKCIETMHEIALEVERTGAYYYDIPVEGEFLSVADSIAASASLCAKKLNASVIVCLSTSGKTATMISSFRPQARILAVTSSIETLNRLEMVWGVQSIGIKPYKSSEEAMAQIESLLLEYGLGSPGDQVILTLGLPVRQGEKTNSLRVFTLGDLEIEKPREIPLRFKV